MLLHSLFNQSLNIIIISHFHKAYNNHDDENDVLKSNESTQILKKKKRENSINSFNFCCFFTLININYFIT